MNTSERKNNLFKYATQNSLLKKTHRIVNTGVSYPKKQYNYSSKILYQVLQVLAN
ncbi:MAG: hypothetical protein ACD_72C00100G0008 [uncultured bacterium]|nr:MAG: hypothetical protein ACD_72C00100G0008 [uncultured bacterium]